MSKIDDFIKENNVKPSECLYHTNRTALNSKKQLAGKIRVLAHKSDGIARVDYTCPECEHHGYTEQEWKRPFSVKCEKCGFRITVPKMKQQAKKEARASE